MSAYVDFVNLMTYDVRGGWSKYTGHHTPLYPALPNASPLDDPERNASSASMTVDYYLDRGMPADKIIIGAAFYGRGWAGVARSSSANGLYQTFTSVPRGTWDDSSSGNTGTFDYKDIKARIASGALRRYWDDAVKAPYAYSDVSNLMISYDDPQSIREKCLYIRQKGIGGLIVWELSADDNGEISSIVYSDLVIATPIPKVIPVPNPTSTFSVMPTSSVSSITAQAEPQEQQQKQSSVKSVPGGETKFFEASIPPSADDTTILNASTLWIIIAGCCVGAAGIGFAISRVNKRRAQQYNQQHIASSSADSLLN